MGGSADRLGLMVPAGDLLVNAMGTKVRMVSRGPGFAVTFPQALLVAEECAPGFRDIVEEAFVLGVRPGRRGFYVSATLRTPPTAGAPDVEALMAWQGLRFRTRLGPRDDVSFGPLMNQRAPYYLKNEQVYFSAYGSASPTPAAASGRCDVANWFHKAMIARREMLDRHRSPYHDLEIELWFTQT